MKLLIDVQKTELIVDYAKSGSKDVLDLVDATESLTLKEMVEWLRGCILAEIYSPEAGEDVICIGAKDWQALKQGEIK